MIQSEEDLIDPGLYLANHLYASEDRSTLTLFDICACVAIAAWQRLRIEILYERSRQVQIKNWQLYVLTFISLFYLFCQ